MRPITKDIHMNWDMDNYSGKKYPPAKAFDGDVIDPWKNMNILRSQLHLVPEVKMLVEYFEDKYDHLDVRCVLRI
jgi:hypothetical protein